MFLVGYYSLSHRPKTGFNHPCFLKYVQIFSERCPISHINGPHFFWHVQLDTARLLRSLSLIWGCWNHTCGFLSTRHSETALTSCSGLLRSTHSLRHLLQQIADLRAVLQPHGERPEDTGWINSNTGGHQGESGGKGPHSKPMTLYTYWCTPPII